MLIAVNALLSAAISGVVVYLALALYAPSVIERVVSDPARVVVVTAGPTRRAQPLSYTVKAGDTLSSIALNFGITTASLMQANGITNPNLLAVGQTIVIPPQDLTPGAAGPTVGATIVASPSPILRITAILRADSPPSSSGEMVIIQNVGSRVNMKGWTLADLNGNLYVFPDFVLEVNAGVRVHSDTGFDTGADLYWGRTSSVWDSNDTATLKDRNGVVVDSYTVRK